MVNITDMMSAFLEHAKEAVKSFWSSPLEPRPACSCHLRYVCTNEQQLENEWQLECTVEVIRSAPCSYFMVVGFGPGGYSGIQELDDGKRLAIFSVWSEDNYNVELVAANPMAHVSIFGGEGTGIKTTMPCQWKEGQPVRFKVRGVRQGDYWYCECSYVMGGEEYFMSEVRRPADAGPLLNECGFYSFIEDWDRCSGAMGHQFVRKAKYTDMKLNGTQLCESNFTKVENGHDTYASQWAIGCVCDDGTGFVLSTGLDEECSVVCDNNTKLRFPKST